MGLLIFIIIILGIILIIPLVISFITGKTSSLSNWTLALSYLIFLPVIAWLSWGIWFLLELGIMLFVAVFDALLSKDKNLYHKNILTVFMINLLLVLYFSFHNASLIYYSNTHALQEPNFDNAISLVLLGPFLIFGLSWLFRSLYFKSYKLFIEFILAMTLAVTLIYFISPNAGMIKYKLFGPKHVQINYEENK